MNSISIKDVNRTEYNKYVFDKDMKYIRPVLLLSIVLYGLFGLMDYLVYPDYYLTFFIIRFAVVTPLLLLVYLISYNKYFYKIYQAALLFIFIISGLGIAMMINLIEGHVFYYGGLYLVFSVAFFMLRLKPRFSAAGVIVILISFIIMGLLIGNMDNFELFTEVLFYVAFAIIGVFGSRYNEQYQLNQYYQEKILEGENVILEKKIYKQYEDIKNYHSATIISLAKLVESRDGFTGGHINRVGVLAEKLAKEIPLEIYNKNNTEKAVFVNTIKLASSLHDIGKIAISDLVLNKPGKLTEEEFETIKSHTTKGYEMLLSIQEDYEDNIFIELGLQISKSHHEKWDGSGYPEGLKGEEIPLSARILAIVDVYDALISERPYKKPYSKEKSLAIIGEGIGTHFDPELAKLFIKIEE